MEDRRKHERVNKNALGSYDVVGEDQKIRDRGMAKTSDVSLKGLQVALPREPGVGDSVKITLNIDGQLIPVRGAVVWSRRGDEVYEAGIQIEQIPEGFEQKVKSLIEQEPDETEQNDET